MPPEILGPFGLAVALIVAVAVLWREHQRADADDRKERDDWKSIAQASQRDMARLTSTIEAKLDIKVPPPSL